MRLIVLCLLASTVFVSVVRAQEQTAQPKSANESWMATIQTSVANNNPTRSTESYAKSGDRAVDTLLVEQLDPDRGYRPDYEIEKETTNVGATSTRTVERTYRWDVNGQRNLVQVIEEARNSVNGDAQVVRTASNSDGNGNLQVIEREVANTRTTGPDTQETETTRFLLDGNGVLTPAAQTREERKRGADRSVEVKKTTLVLDSGGNWAVGEVKEGSFNEDGKSRISEERVSLADSEGRLSEVSRTFGKETETPTGEKSNTVETYRTEVPGSASDGIMHLNWRVTTVENKNSTGKITEQQVEQPNTNDPTANLQVAAKTQYIVQYGASGLQQTKTTQVRDLNGDLSVVSVEARKSDQAPPEDAQTDRTR